MTKYPIYSEEKARELPRYLPEGTRFENDQCFGVRFYSPKCELESYRTVRGLVEIATQESHGHLPPGSTAAIAGMVAGKVEFRRCVDGSADWLNCTSDDATHLLIEVSK